MQVGDLVIYKNRYRDTFGIVIKCGQKVVRVAWADGMTFTENKEELEIITKK